MLEQLTFVPKNKPPENQLGDNQGLKTDPKK